MLMMNVFFVTEFLNSYQITNTPKLNKGSNKPFPNKGKLIIEVFKYILVESPISKETNGTDPLFPGSLTKKVEKNSF